MTTDKKPVQLTVGQVRQMTTELANAGVHPSAIRQGLANYGVRWRYVYAGGSGARERMRNLKRLGRTPCLGGCGGSKPIGAELCELCLEAKWSAQPGLRLVGRGSPE